MAPNLLSLEKLGYALPSTTSTKAAAQASPASQISPIPPAPLEAQTPGLVAEQEREAAVQNPNAGWTGTTGQIANLAGAFLHGIAQGRATAQVIKYQRMQKQGNDLATAYGMARQTLLPLESQAYQHQVSGRSNMPGLSFAVDPNWLTSPAGQQWQQKFLKAYNAVNGTRSAYIDYVQQNTIPEPEKGAGKRKHRSTASNIFHKAETASLDILKGGPSLPEGYTEAAQEMVKMLPMGHTADEIAMYQQDQGLAGLSSGKLQVTYQTVMGPDGKPHRYEIDALTGARRDLGVAATTTPAAKITYQTLVGPDGKAHRYQIDEATGKKTDLGLAPTTTGTAHVSYQTLLGPDGKYHRYQVDETTGKKTDLGITTQPSSSSSASPAASNKFALQQALTDVRAQIAQDNSAITSMEGKIPAVQKASEGAVSRLERFVTGQASQDPVAQLQKQISDRKAHLATLEIMQGSLERASANYPNANPEDVSWLIGQAHAMLQGTGSPASGRVTVSKGGRYYTVPQSQLSEAIRQGYTQVETQ